MCNMDNNLFLLQTNFYFAPKSSLPIVDPTKTFTFGLELHENANLHDFVGHTNPSQTIRLILVGIWDAGRVDAHISPLFSLVICTLLSAAAAAVLFLLHFSCYCFSCLEMIKSPSCTATVPAI